MFAAWFLVVFNILFPKGGFKAGSIPLTWGFLFIVGSSAPLLLYRFLALPLRSRSTACLALLCTLPMQAVYLYVGYAFGLADPGFGIANVINFLVLPWLFLLVYPPFFKMIDGQRLQSYFCWSILLAAVWGIFLFFLHPITGHYIEIPFLTVNAGDYGLLEATKNNQRGLFPKLISTYNNGNIYGVATLIILPLFERLEAKPWKRNVVKLALILTLSRTVWLGLVLYEAGPVLLHALQQVRTFPKIFIRSVMGRVVVVVATGVLIVAALLFNGSKLNFLLDSSGGGRAGMFDLLFTADLLPSNGMQGFNETVYSSVAHLYGFLGLGAFVLMMGSPLILLLVDRSAMRSVPRRAALKGLMLYMVLVGIDGCINYVPVMIFYWFVYMVYACGWPGESDGRYVPAAFEIPVRKRWFRRIPPLPRPAV